MGDASETSPPVMGWASFHLAGDELHQSPGVAWPGPVLSFREPMYRLLLPEHLRDPLPDMIQSFKDRRCLSFAGPVVASLESFGAVVEHRFGWSAEAAVIRQLWVISDPLRGNKAPAPMEALQERYGCPIHLLSSRESEAWLGTADPGSAYAPRWVGDRVREFRAADLRGPSPAHA